LGESMPAQHWPHFFSICKIIDVPHAPSSQSFHDSKHLNWSKHAVHANLVIHTSTPKSTRWRRRATSWVNHMKVKN